MDPKKSLPPVVPLHEVFPKVKDGAFTRSHSICLKFFSRLLTILYYVVCQSLTVLIGFILFL
jgi:hypothetical protein